MKYKKEKLKETEYCICMEIYAPVCGRDKKTYGNACLAQCKHVKFQEGECLE